MLFIPHSLLSLSIHAAMSSILPLLVEQYWKGAAVMGIGAGAVAVGRRNNNSDNNDKNTR